MDLVGSRFKALKGDLRLFVYRMKLLFCVFDQHLENQAVESEKSEESVEEPVSSLNGQTHLDSKENNNGPNTEDPSMDR